MIHTNLAKSVLTTGEQLFLTKIGVKSMKGFQEQLDFMKKENPRQPGSVYPECWNIAQKLRLIDFREWD
jgi:hypothetical protein